MENPVIRVSWDWFFAPLTAEEKALTEAKKLSAVVREDGDDEAAIVMATKGVDAPAEHTRLITIDPLIGDCFLAIAWDDRACECVEVDEEDEDDEDDEDDE